MNWTPLFALLTGAIVGIVFGLTELPIPAPPRLAGIMGIVGIYAGYRLVESWDLLLELLPT